MKSKSRGKLSYALQALNIIPLLFLGFLILILGSHWFKKSMYAEVETELSNMVVSLSAMIDELHPGDYKLVGENAYYLYKGEDNITTDYALIDRIKKETGLEITLFYKNTRILTTITDGDSVRIVGSGAPDTVIREVLETGMPRFYEKTVIYGKSYFSYYVPLFNQDGSVVGMLFAGKPSFKVNNAVQEALYPLVIADILLMILVSFFTFRYTGKIASALMQLHTFLKSVAGGNLKAKLDMKLLGRSDEIGEIAHCALDMQRSLYNLVEQDALTALANRRSGDKQLRQLTAECYAKKIPFCVVLGDIDFFKKVNDTYGHDCGDAVLKRVSSILRQHMRGKGFASRWGGEEFLLVFQNATSDEAYALLQTILEAVRNSEIVYDDQTISVTMTFGLVSGFTSDVKQLLCSADEKLYEGKTAGRNRIVI